MSKDFKELAIHSGFSRVLGTDSSQFMLLDKDTDGAQGRRIYIDGRLASLFTGMDVNAAKSVFSKIKQLRATAGGIGSYANLSNAMEHMTVIGSVGVRYKIFQITHDPNKLPGVYITNLDLGDFKDGAPGLYKVSKNESGWKLDDKPRTSIETGFAAINGALCRDLMDAGEVIMPELHKATYQQAADSNLLQSRGYTLCYNPPSIYHKGESWQKRTNKTVAAVHLKQALLNAQARKQKVKWAVHSDGAHLLYDALRLVGERNLSCHTMVFLGPTKDVSKITPLIRKSNINLDKRVMVIQSDDWRSKSAQMRSGRKLQKELRLMDGFEQRALRLRVDARESMANGLSYCFSSGTMSYGLTSFLLAPTLAPTAALGVAAVGAAVGAYGTIGKAQSLRNILANNLKNPGLNPHMHPFKDSSDMNLHVQKHSGNIVKTFVDVAKELIKG